MLPIFADARVLLFAALLLYSLVPQFLPPAATWHLSNCFAPLILQDEADFYAGAYSPRVLVWG